MRTIGVLGGMGPYATLAFFRSLLQATPARKDWEHVRIIIDDNPHIPSRTRHVLFGEASPAPAMLESCRKLEAYPVDFIAVPCNSAVIFLPEIQPQLRVRLLDIRDIAAAALAQRSPEASRVAVFGGHVTYSRRTYAAALEAQGKALVDHGADVQREVERVIESLKLGEVTSAAVHTMTEVCAQAARDKGAQAVLLACTEFACLPQLDTLLPMVDSSAELARYAVDLALRGEAPVQ